MCNFIWKESIIEYLICGWTLLNLARWLFVHGFKSLRYIRYWLRVLIMFWFDQCEWLRSLGSCHWRFLFPSQQLRCQQVDQRGQQVTEGPDQHGDWSPSWSAPLAGFHKTTALPASTHGPGLRLRQEIQLLPARWVKNGKSWTSAPNIDRSVQ